MNPATPNARNRRPNAAARDGSGAPHPIANSRQVREQFGPMTVLRRRFFADASAEAMAYAVTFDEVADHLRRLAPALRRSGPRTIRHMPDLVLAVACVRNHVQAWQDLQSRHERSLVLAAMTDSEPVDAIVAVRRLLATLRRETAGGLRLDHSLRTYSGRRPIRGWLIDRLLLGMRPMGDAFTPEPRGRRRVAEVETSDARLPRLMFPV